MSEPMNGTGLVPWREAGSGETIYVSQENYDLLLRFSTSENQGKTT